MSFASAHRDPLNSSVVRNDRILVVSGRESALDLLRLAIIRTDDVVFIGDHADHEARRYALRFAIEIRTRPMSERDLTGVSAVLLSIGDDEAENRIVRIAHRRHVPVHVVGRPLVSDFTILALLQQCSLTAHAA